MKARFSPSGLRTGTVIALFRMLWRRARIPHGLCFAPSWAPPPPLSLNTRKPPETLSFQPLKNIKPAGVEFTPPSLSRHFGGGSPPHLRRRGPILVGLSWSSDGRWWAAELIVDQSVIGVEGTDESNGRRVTKRTGAIIGLLRNMEQAV